MTRNRDMAASFLIALLIHAVGAVFAGNLASVFRQDMMPAFKQGETAVLITLAPSFPIEEPDSAESPETVMTAPEADVKAMIEDMPRQKAPLVQDVGTADRGAVSAPQAESPISPRYPRGARMRGEEGVVVLLVKVDAKGRASSVTVGESSGYAVLDRAAVKAARQTRYIPGREDGQPIDGEAMFSVEFKFLN
jgi:protein TonB